MAARCELKSVLKTVDQFMNTISKNLYLVTYFVVGLMVVPIVINVMMRVVLRQSIIGVIELQEAALVLITFLGLAQMENLGENIRMDLFVNKFSKKIRGMLDNLTYLLTFLMIAITTWHTFPTIIRKLPDRTANFRIPISVFIGIVALSLLLLTLVLLRKYLISTVEIIKKKQSAYLILPIFLGLLFALLPVYVKSISIGVNGFTLGIFGILILFVFLIIGMPLGFAMIIIGYVGMFVTRKNSLAVYAMLGSAPYFNVANYVFAVLPMFVLMGAIANYSGISKDLFKTAQKWFGNIPGGLAISSIAGCAGFAAVCGDSMACAVTMGSVAYPEMKRHQYNSAISTGCLAAGGTLGILIPPSIGFIIYSIISEESVGKLFIAGIIPGILLAILFIICIWVLNKFRPHWFPVAERFTLKERIVSLTKIWAVVALFVLILGGMLGGFFSPNEGGAVGAFGAFLIGIFRRRLNVKDFVESLKETAAITNRLFLIIIGVGILGYFLAATRFPNYLADFVLSLGAGKYTILIAIFFLYLILGCLMNVIPMIMLTLPAIYPTIIAVGFDPLWFGVFTVLLMEMGQISPPVGINVFSISIVTDVPMGTIFKGIFPFLLCMFICLVILTVFPELALFLVDKFSIS